MLRVVERWVCADDLLVLRQDRIPLTRSTAEDPVEVVEAPAVRPPVERPGRTLLTVRCQMPLPERGRAVSVVPQDPRQRRTVSRQDRGIAREAAGELADRPEPDRMVVPPGQQRRARRRAERGDMAPVVTQPSVGNAGEVRRLDRSAERARVPESGIVDEDQQDVRRTLRWRRMSDEVPIGLRSVEGPFDDSIECLSAYRELAAVDFAHRHVLPRSPAESSCTAISAPSHAIRTSTRVRRYPESAQRAQPPSGDYVTRGRAAARRRCAAWCSPRAGRSDGPLGRT